MPTIATSMSFGAGRVTCAASGPRLVDLCGFDAVEIAHCLAELTDDPNRLEQNPISDPWPTAMTSSPTRDDVSLTRDVDRLDTAESVVQFFTAMRTSEPANQKLMNQAGLIGGVATRKSLGRHRESAADECDEIHAGLHRAAQDRDNDVGQGSRHRQYEVEHRTAGLAERGRRLGRT